jgi:hypothetical protein
VSEYLFRISLESNGQWGNIESVKPIYVVERSKAGAKVYAEKHIRNNLKVKSVSFCGERLGMNMYSGGKSS